MTTQDSVLDVFNKNKAQKATLEPATDKIPDLLMKGIHFHQITNFQSAEKYYKQALNINPQFPEALQLMGMLQMDLKNMAAAKEYLYRALSIRGKDPDLYCKLGDIFLAESSHNEAKDAFNHALEIDPKCVCAMIQLATMYLKQEEYEKAQIHLINASEIDPDNSTIHDLFHQLYRQYNRTALANYHKKLAVYLLTQSLIDYTHSSHDTLFFDSSRALEVARQRNTFTYSGVLVKCIQTCFYFGKSLPDAPFNLVAIPEDVNEAALFFITTDYRIPGIIDFDPSLPEQREFARESSQWLDTFTEFRIKYAHKLASLVSKQSIVFKEDEPLRILLTSSIYTLVMQYCSKYLARAFEKLGHLVNFVIEKDCTRSIPPCLLVNEYYNFKPHIVIVINHSSPSFLPANTFCITWWQDGMNELINPGIINWRPRDIVLSAFPQYDYYLQKKGVKSPIRQRLCVDTDLFFPATPFESRRKVTFIGSSGHHMVDFNNKNHVYTFDILVERMEAGAFFSTDYIEKIYQELPEKLRSDIAFEFFNSWLLYNVIREKSVEWMCEVGSELGLEVEVYGRYWEHNPIIRPYFKGELPHGKEIAKIYNQSRFALEATPGTVYSQRVGEICACATIPVVYDSRGNSEAFSFEDRLLFFKNRAELKACLQQKQAIDVLPIAQAYTYDSMAQSIVNLVREHLAEEKAQTSIDYIN
ncbi:MAG: tetratricopeptide repeat protein [Magnetococcales bacterium]|nr:tetratricopeptide repeat protein [Magnetococcales bacterium]